MILKISTYIFLLEFDSDVPEIELKKSSLNRLNLLCNDPLVHDQLALELDAVSLSVFPGTYRDFSEPKVL